MFSAEPWARAFTGSFSGESVSVLEDGFFILRDCCAAALSVPGDLTGFRGAFSISPLLDAAFTRASLASQAGSSTAAGRTKNFFLLMIQKGCFHQYRKILERIRQLVNERKALVEADLETPFEPDGAFLESVRRILLEKTHAREVTITNRVVPELVGGIRLRMGSVLFDGSLKTALEKMKADLSAL